MKVLLVAEGQHELHGALKALVERLVGVSIDIVSKRVSDRGLSRLRGKGPRLLKRAIRWMRDAREEGYDALVLIVDQDGDRNRGRLFDQAQDDTSVPIRRALGVAIRTFDAWMLADEKHLSTVFGTTIQRLSNPEEIDEPKGICERFRASYSPDSGLAEVYTLIATGADLDIMRERCSNGFAPFADRVCKLIEA
jgi:hypothetical protein